MDMEPKECIEYLNRDSDTSLLTKVITNHSSNDHWRPTTEKENSDLISNFMEWLCSEY